jgi:hypothetical protein
LLTVCGCCWLPPPTTDERKDDAAELPDDEPAALKRRRGLSELRFKLATLFDTYWLMLLKKLDMMARSFPLFPGLLGLF